MTEVTAPVEFKAYKAIIIETGEAVKVTAEAKGWATLKAADGSTRKIRSKAIQPAKAVKAPKADGAVPPKREPAPAHFVKDMLPEGEEKTAKIGSTAFNLGRYFVSDTKTESGRRTIDCADNIAETLRGLALADVYIRASEETGKTVKELKTQYEHLNLGMQRMNLGNRIRGAIAEKARAEQKAIDDAAKPTKAAKPVAEKIAKVDAKAKRAVKKATSAG